MNFTKNNLILQILVLIFFLCLSMEPIYLVNYRVLVGSYHHYWGLNYYLNGLISLSYNSWQKALSSKNLYIADIRQDFASNVQQGYQAGVIFNPIEQVHLEGLEAIKANIADHPFNYFYYNFLAEYYNVFYDLHAEYLVEGEKMSDKAWEISPNRQEILYTKAKTALVKGETTKAKDLFQKAIELNPLAGEPHLYFGILALERGDIKTGLAEVKIAKELGREPRNLQEAMIIANFVADAGDYDWAIEIFRVALTNMENAKVVGLDFQNKKLDIKLKIAVSLYLGGRREEAREAFQELSKEVNFKEHAIYSELKPIFDSLELKI